MSKTYSSLLKELIELSPLCSGFLHERYLSCGKQSCRCHDVESPKLHGPFYIWSRRINSRLINRSLQVGAELERVKEGIANYKRFKELIEELLQQEEEKVLSPARAVVTGNESKKNFRRRLRKQ